MSHVTSVIHILKTKFLEIVVHFSNGSPEKADITDNQTYSKGEKDGFNSNRRT